MLEDISRILFTEEQIKARVEELGKQISADFKGEDIVVIGLLKGCFMFIADLMRAIDTNVAVDFMVVSSYGSGVVSSGEIKVRKDYSIDIEGKNVLVIDDILDTGRTLAFVKDYLIVKSPKTIKLCTLLDKPERKTSKVEVDYVGFSVPDEFVVGYGLDYDEKYRNLPFIGVLKPEVYK
ncbi:MAG: hypoxanthine phosphoribosyltransferase [Oscillospiraceae bacterium]|jgi:hypoxanthine phosphoribosyltransferase|nr:hypoxanthine phosphoribosyltransferase [Oscillospiraceae bacterium]